MDVIMAFTPEPLQKTVPFELLHPHWSPWWLMLGLSLIALLLMEGLRRLLLMRLNGWAQQASPEGFAGRTSSFISSLLRDLCHATSPWVPWAFLVFFASQSLEIPPRLERWIALLPLWAGLLQIGAWTPAVLKFAFSQWLRHYPDPDRVAELQLLYGPLRVILCFLVWVLLLFVALDSIGINITAFVTGLGIGGVALALAVQNILGDLLAALSIVLEKPFALGDFVALGDSQGTVEHIGLKTTRLRSLQGEQLLIPNGDMVKSRIRNFKRMQERRVPLVFEVALSTPAAVLAELPKAIEGLVEQQPQTRFERAHFKGPGHVGWAFEVIYWMTEADYTLFMDNQQALWLELLALFEQRQIALVLAAPGTVTTLPK
jgi:small-conductance mechanosensitive channel